MAPELFKKIKEIDFTAGCVSAAAINNDAAAAINNDAAAAINNDAAARTDNGRQYCVFRTILDLHRELAECDIDSNITIEAKILCKLGFLYRKKAGCADEFEAFLTSRLKKIAQQYDDATAAQLLIAMATVSSEENELQDEVYYSKMALTYCKPVDHYIAFKYTITYMESLKRIAYTLRVLGQNKESNEYSSMTENACKAIMDSFDLDANELARVRGWKYRAMENYSINCFYTGDKQKGLEACDYLITAVDVPADIYNGAFTNLKYYARGIVADRTVSKGIKLGDLMPGFIEDDPIYTLSNTCIYKAHPDSTRATILARYVDYRILDSGAYVCNNNGVATRNYIMDYDLITGAISNRREVIPPPVINPAYIKNLEDCRIATYDGKHYITATSWEHHGHYNPRIVMGIMNPDGVIPSAVMPPYETDKIQKNWTPFVYKGRLCLLYSLDPFIVLEYDTESGGVREIINRRLMPSRNYHFLRGSTPPIEWRNGYLIAVHEVIMNEYNQRIYLHRFIHLDSELVCLKISLPFSFVRRGIEFTLGMCYDHINNCVLLPASVNDSKPVLWSIPDKQVLDLLDHVNYYA